MAYLLVALALFWLIRFLQNWVDAPGWVWQLVQPILAMLALIPWNQDWLRWYTPLAISAIVTFLQFAENLLIAKADEALTAIMRRR